MQNYQENIEIKNIAVSQTAFFIVKIHLPLDKRRQVLYNIVIASVRRKNYVSSR